MKLKKILALVTALLISFSVSACNFLPTSSSTANESADSENSLDNSSSDENDSGDNSNSQDTSSENSDNFDSAEEEEEKPEINEEHCLIVDQAYALSKNETLGYYTLKGEIKTIDAPYSNGTICLTFFVWGRENYPMYCYEMQGDGIQNLQEGDYITVYGSIKNYKDEKIEFDKNCLLLEYQSNGNLPAPENDPYANITESEFYANYTLATDSADAYYRTLHGFMSGSLTVPDQEPAVSTYQPMRDGKFIRNSEIQLSKDQKTCVAVDAYGNPVFEVYKYGAYITLEEVAAYVYAFGTYPANYTTSNKTKPTDSIWGEYLRVNYTDFSGDTSRYPYEPILPNITGCGGNLQYYEMDIGTTGTDCDPSYPTALYNNGYSITRGAARVVHGKQDLNNNGIYELGEHHLFYTYNHYNDFQEYLGYVGGWGEMFGNITGGGTISSKYDCNPTDYVEVYLEALPSSQTALASVYAHRYKENPFIWL